MLFLVLLFSDITLVFSLFASVFPTRGEENAGFTFGKNRFSPIIGDGSRIAIGGTAQYRRYSVPAVPTPAELSLRRQFSIEL